MNDHDAFAWQLGEPPPATMATAGAARSETITEFDPSAAAHGGDVLDLRDLLQGDSPDTLSHFLHFATSGGDTVISISSSGAYAAAYDASKTDQMLTLANVDLCSAFSLPGATDAQMIQELLTRGKLLTDGHG